VELGIPKAQKRGLKKEKKIGSNARARALAGIGGGGKSSKTDALLIHTTLSDDGKKHL